MGNKVPDKRVLAIDLRRRRFGYAVLEGGGEHRLLDWGATSYPSDTLKGPDEAGKRISKLLKLFHPSVLIVRTARGTGPDVGLLVEAVQKEAISRVVPVCIFNRSDEAPVSHGKSNHDTASALAQRFPELLPKLPPKRKAWESERHNMIVFGAVTAGLAYLQNGEADRPEAD